MARPFFVFVFAAYPILHIAAVNSGQVSWTTVGSALLVALAAAALLMVLLRPVATSWHSAALAVSLLAAAFFSYASVHTLIEPHYQRAAVVGERAEAEMTADGIHAPLSAIWAAVALAGVAGVCLLARRVPAASSRRLTSALNVTAGVLLAFVGVELATSWGGRGAGTASREATRPQGVATSALGYDPDIYYVILDGYARADVLQSHYGFDNREFLDALRARGLTVSDASSANYSWTFLSLASSLNLGYLQEMFGPRLDPQQTDRTLLYRAVRDNLAARFLRGRGYRFVHFQSTWGATLFNPYADEEVRCYDSVFRQEFYRAIAEASWLKALQSRASADLAQCYLAHFDSLGRMGSAPGPKFVFVHFLPPHHPYLFDREGRVLRNANLSNQFEFQKRLWEEKESYIEQLLFVNKQILAAIDRILETSPRPPIIVVQSDHGPNLTKGLTEEERFRVRLANFAAYHLPGAPPGLIPGDTSPVNQFRILFSHYFGAQLPPLAERHYTSTYRQPYAFVEVSGL